MRDYAHDSDLPGRNRGRDDCALSAATTTTAPAAAADDHLSGRIHGSGRGDLSNPAAAPGTAASGAAFGRTRLILGGRRKCAGHPLARDSHPSHPRAVAQASIGAVDRPRSGIPTERLPP